MTLAEFLLFLLVFVVFHVFIRQLLGGKSRQGRPLPPCLPSLPLVGSIPFIRDFGSLPDQFMRKAEQLGPVIGFYIGRKFVLVLNGREAIREALLKHAFSDRLVFFMEQTHTNRNAKGLLSKNYDADFKHYHQLTLSILKEFGFGVKHLTEQRIIVEVDSLVTAIEDMRGQPFNPEEFLKIGVANVISGFLFGRAFEWTSPERQETLRKIRESIDHFQDAFELAVVVAPVMRLIPYYGKRFETGRRAHGELLRLLERELEISLSDERETVDCLVRRFISAEGPQFDREQLMFTMRDLFIGGSDTTSVTIQWGLVFLANHPPVQDRLRKEIDRVVARERLPSIDDRVELVYLEAVVLETMRIRTLVPFSTPHATLTDTEIKGYFIPAGTMVLPNLYSVHMDPKTWTDPTEFRPERFLDDNNRLIHRDKILPFSVGKRSCLGETLARHELFVFLGSLVQRFVIEPPTGLRKVNDVAEVPRGLVKPSPDIQLRFLPREPQQ